MRNYIIKRLLLMIPTLFVVTVIVFLLVRMIPGTVIDMMLAERKYEEGIVETEKTIELQRAALSHALGLDVPVHIQYARWIGNVFRGDLGKSLWTGLPISQEVRNRLPVTIELSIMSLIISTLIGIPIGVYAAIRQDSITDYIMRTFSIVGLSVPSFFTATLIMIWPSIWWNWSPNMLYTPLVEDPLGNLWQFFIPAFIMGLQSSAGLMRVTRTMMLEVMRQDYIRTAWSKGLKERVVIARHAVKNTLIPVVTIIGGTVPSLFAGSVIMEQMFNLPGMGRYLLAAAVSRDYPIISSFNLCMAVLVLIVILATDITYAYVDPRIRYK
jgi:peptide/nickel transport system permease protein